MVFAQLLNVSVGDTGIPHLIHFLFVMYLSTDFLCVNVHKILKSMYTSITEKKTWVSSLQS